MKVLILTFSNNMVNEESYIPNKMGLTFACEEQCEKALQEVGHEYEHICINKKRIDRCIACGERGWGLCLTEHQCVLQDDFNEIYNHMADFDAYIFITPVYFHEMSESCKALFDRIKRCDAFNGNSKIRGKKVICIAAAGGTGYGGTGQGAEETLIAFDRLCHFLKLRLYGRIPVNKGIFEDQKQLMRNCIGGL